MERLTTGNKTIQADQVYKIAKGQEAQALQAAQESAADDVLIKMGNDTFAASGRGMDLKGVKAGDKIQLQGQEGTVLLVDDKLNSAKDAFRKPLAASGKVLGVGAAIAVPSLGGLAWAQLTFKAASGVVPIWPMAAMVGVAVGGALAILGGAGLVTSMVFGANRKVDTTALKPYAEDEPAQIVAPGKK